MSIDETQDSAPIAQIIDLKPGGFITVITNGESLSIREESPRFSEAVAAFQSKEWTKFYDIMKPERMVKRMFVGYGDVLVKDGEVRYMGDLVRNTIVERIFAFGVEGLDPLPLIKFLNRLMANPSHRAVTELYDFLEHKNLPVTTEGSFLAYKSITPEYKDWQTKTFDNSVGQTLRMARNKVDDDTNHDCSYGFHAGSLEYASDFYNGVNIVIVEIDPADVVSIPRDANCQKLRTCRYSVIGNYNGPLVKPCYKTYEDGILHRSWWNDEDFDDEDFDDEDIDDEE